MKSRNNNRAAWFLCLFLSAVLLASFLCALHAAGHDCEGENCAVCAAISNLEELLQRFALPGALTAFAALWGVCTPEGIARAAGRFSRTLTPVARKVRLND